MRLGACMLAVASVLMLWCGTWVACGEDIYFTNVTTQEILEAFAAPFVATAGGTAYAGANGGVCVARNSIRTLVPLTASLMGNLYGAVNNGTIDPLHGCYLSAASADGTRSCVAQISSSPAECGDDPEASLDNAASRLAKGRTEHVYISSAEALVASIKLPYGDQQLTLARSLLRTRELESLLDTEEALLSTLGVEQSSDNAEAQLAACVSRISELVQRSYDTVMAKYDVLRSWLNQSLGTDAVPRILSVSCPLNDTMKSLLDAQIPKDLLGVALLTMINLTNVVETQRDEMVKIQPLVCLQGIYAVASLAIEDARIRRLHRLLTDGTISLTNPPTREILRGYLFMDGDELLKNLQSDFQFTIDYITTTLFAANGDKLGECFKRAVLRVPYPSTGELPPSVFWCLDRTLAPAVRVALPYVSERVATRCPPGQSLWDGSCGGKFDVRRCVRCPNGSVLTTDGYCGCVDPGSYVKSTGGCAPKGDGNEPPTYQWKSEEGGVVRVPSAEDGEGKAPMPLFTVSLPPAAAPRDESAYLSVSATCELGATTLMMSPVGNRSAVCGKDVAYERRIERTGLMLVGPGPGGKVVAETYATSLEVSVVSTGGVLGDKCTFTATVGSTLRKASKTASVGTVTLLMQAAPLKLSTSGFRMSDNITCDALPSQPARGDGIALGVCTGEEGGSALYFDPRGYRFLPSSGLDALLSSAATRSDASPLKSVLDALRGRVGLRMVVLGEGDEVLARSEWLPSRDDTAGAGWRAVYVLYVPNKVLEAMRRVQVEVLDLLNGSALAPRLDTVAYAFSESELSALYADSIKYASQSKSNAEGNPSHTDLPWLAFIACAAILCVLIASQICLMFVLRRRLGGAEKDAADRGGCSLEKAQR